MSIDLSRRSFIRTVAASAAVTMSGWFGNLARAATQGSGKPPRACILLWMNGGPSQMDTFDLKPGHANGGPYQGDRHQRARHQDQRASAEDSPGIGTTWPSSAR